MATTAYSSITITDLLDTATYIYYSSSNSRTTDSTNINKWHISPQSGDTYIGIYSGPSVSGGQPNPITSDILTDTNNFIISKYVGRSVTSITKTSTSNNIDTYTIQYSDGTSSTFTVTNGINGTSSQWYYGTGITGISTIATSYPNSGVTSAIVGDMYLNTETSNVYKCTVAGNAATAKWVYAGNIVDGVLNNLEIGGRNLAVIRTAQEGYLTASATIGNLDPNLGSMNSINREHTSDYIAVSEYKNYVLQYWATIPNGYYSWCAYRIYDSEKKCLQSRWSNQGNAVDSDTEWYKELQITMPENAAFIRISMRFYNDGKWKFEKGNIATDWTPAPEDVESTSIEYIIGTGTSAGLWKGKTNKTSLYEGMQIGYWINIAGGSLKANNATVAANIKGGVPNTVDGFAGTWLNLTLSDGTETGWYPCFYGGTTRLTTHYGVNNSIRLVFKQNISVTISNIAYTVSGWWADAQYYSNTYDRTYYSNQVKAETAITAGHIICGTSAGYKNVAAGVSFDLLYPILYSPNAIEANSYRTDTYIMIPSVNIRTSYGADIPGFAVNKKVYLKGTIVANTFTIAATEWITAIEPSSEDSYYYIPLGSFANNATVSNAIIYFISSSTLYKFYDGAFQQIASATMVTTEDINDTITDATQLWYSTEAKSNTLTGDIVSFDNPEDERAIKSLEVEINAVQDLHGQDAPYPAGGGKNLIDVSDYSGDMTSYYIDKNCNFALTADVTYTLSATVSTSVVPFSISVGCGSTGYSKDISTKTNLQNGRVFITFTPTATQLSSGTNLFMRFPRYNSSTTCTIFVTNIQLELGSSATTYAPYSNICPISRYSACELVRCGVNLFDKSTAVNGAYIDDITGEERAAANDACSAYISVVPNVSYYISSEQTMGAWGAWYDADKNYISGITGYIASNTDAQKTKTAPSNARYMRLTIIRTGNGNAETFAVNYPSTDHDYHAYNGTTHTIPFGQTVYGGVLEVESGVLTVTHGCSNLNGSWNWIKSSSYSGGFYADVRNVLHYKANTPFICSHAKSAASLTDYVAGTCFCDGSINFRLMQASDTVQDWKDYITAQANANTPITICYELATPTTIQLTPVEVSTLLGQNNIWADSGTVTVSYTSVPDLPAAPTAHVTNAEIKSKIWTKVKPENNTNYPYLYYCYEFLKNNDEYNWSDVVLDIAALEKIKQLDKTIISVTPLYYATGLALKSQSGSLVYLTDHDDENAVEHINITIPVATQGGSGTASPINNRPINGLNNFNLIVSPTTTASDGNTYTITFDSTQYGGDLEIISGQYIKKYQYLELNGNLNQNWSIEDENTANQRYILSLKNPGDPTLTQISNRFVFTSSTANNQTWGKMRISDKVIFYDTAKTFTTDDNNTALNKFKLWLSENPVQLCYQLVFPINTYLNPTEITILSNENYIWSNIGNIEVTYLTAPTLPLAPTYHIENFNSSYNEWTTIIPKYDINYPYYYNCYEYLMGSGRYVWSTVFLDEATTGTIKDFRKKTNNLGYLVQSTNAKFITGQDNLTELVSTSYQTLEGLKTSTAQTKLEIDKFSIDFNDVLQGVKSSFEFIPATATTEAAVEIKSKLVGEQEGKIYSHIGSETYQFRETSNNNPVFEIDTDGTTGRRADVTGQVGIGAGTVANYFEQWAIRKGENHGTSENPYYDLQIVWVGGDAPSTT